MTVREVITLEPEDGEELLECIEHHKIRTDGGRTVINLVKSCVYFLHQPLVFDHDTQRLTINFQGMEARPDGPGCIIADKVNQI